MHGCPPSSRGEFNSRLGLTHIGKYNESIRRKSRSGVKLLRGKLHIFSDTLRNCIVYHYIGPWCNGKHNGFQVRGWRFDSFRVCRRRVKRNYHAGLITLAILGSTPRSARICFIYIRSFQFLSKTDGGGSSCSR